ncbi:MULTISPECIES: PhnE/PtxC family ABC transporter permease [unclassified Mesorhizobium]|uniref:PhnE/PtxC family ABC transporter permease n=1 Tax=unclassified Mesorhizobium TaxID=325217 RepID=UPI00112E652D|nr:MULTISPECIES: ABC transporter permease subunit [unclassified Mesorhizobium]MBZ9701622.1 ABC transporter permease subunit [Mesorhizobium sp. CO1-1-3]MBZ9949232.1 ABC transporter permease subunit [Mesorhizobium sp. BR1-1-11]TPI99571.1 ABC transporter permease subunit [Mesorhizobium sp. B2-8-1]
MSVALDALATPKRRWSRYRHPESTIRFSVILAVLVFLGYSVNFLNIHLDRILGAFPRLAEILATRYFPPDLDYLTDGEFVQWVVRTLEMSLLGGFFGVVCSVPLAWLAVRNITVSRRIAYPLGRFAIIGSRSIHETIWTILFVTILGFGMLAGTLALTVFCIGFAGKLFSDELEAIDMGPVESLRSVGAQPLQVFQYAVLPQVRVAFTGIAIYTWDVAFRAATVVGFFGGDGMAWYLKRTTQQLENTRVAAILLVIIRLVLLAEIGSGWLRKKIGKMR